MTAEQWPGDMPGDDDKKRKESLDRQVRKIQNLENNIAQDNLRLDSLRRGVSFLNRYIAEKQAIPSPDAEFIALIKKVSNLVSDLVQLNEIYTQNTKISYEEKDPKDYEDLSLLEDGYDDEQEIESINITTFSPRPGVDEEMLHNLNRKRDEINEELTKLEEELEEKYPEENKIIIEYMKGSENKDN